MCHAGSRSYSFMYSLMSWVLWGSWLPRLLYTWPLKMTDWAECKSLTQSVRVAGASNLVRAVPSLLRRTSIKQAMRAFSQQQLHLNLVDVTRHDAIQDERSPARRHPKVHVQAGRRGRKPMARRRGQLGHAAHPLRRPKRELCVVNGWRRLRKRGAQRCATAVGEAQPGLDKDERGIELVALRDGNDRHFAQEAVLIFDGRGTG